MEKENLKDTLLEIVENQLEKNDPPAVSQACRQLLAAGYSLREAKERIGSVVLTEIYDVLKANQPYNEERYTQALEEMVQQSIDFEGEYDIPTEWDDWYDLVTYGYDLYDMEAYKDVVEIWWKAWEIFRPLVGHLKKKASVSGLMEEQDFQYPIDGWLQDLEMVLGNENEHEKRLDFCRTVLDILDWTSYDDDSGFRAAIGEELYRTGKESAGRNWFENWLERDPHNQNALSVYSWCLESYDSAEKAYSLIREEVIDIPCTFDNNILFERAKYLAEKTQKEEDLKWICSQLDSFYTPLQKADEYNDLHDSLWMPVQQPIKKEKKIYPNDPCPCGSGKKYKKCCGKK